MREHVRTNPVSRTTDGVRSYWILTSVLPYKKALNDSAKCRGVLRGTEKY